MDKTKEKKPQACNTTNCNNDKSKENKDCNKKQPIIVVQYEACCNMTKSEAVPMFFIL